MSLFGSIFGSLVGRVIGTVAGGPVGGFIASSIGGLAGGGSPFGSNSKAGYLTTVKTVPIPGATNKEQAQTFLKQNRKQYKGAQLSRTPSGGFQLTYKLKTFSATGAAPPQHTTPTPSPHV